MSQHQCGTAGCSNGAEATFEGRPFCPIHFYNIASERFAQHRARLSEGDPAGSDRMNILHFVSELISVTTILVASAKSLGQEQRDQFLQLSMSAAELYKRVQREPRIARNLPIVISRKTDSTGRQELTNTLDVSRRGACIATKAVWKAGEQMWVQKPPAFLRALARVAWVKKTSPLQSLLGLEILDCEDFWKLQ
ncbi:MAG TPA: hypothetical protein VJX29_05770 [Candidatus Acidoferrales bacterium]|nr:hypothetical protein [Candidatus Acidoferrales bacterium]